MNRSALFILAGLALVGCTPAVDAPPPQARAPQAQVRTQAPLPDGVYQVQNASYNDGSGAYTVFMLNPPKGMRPVLETTELQMAQIDTAKEPGKKSYLEVKGGTPALYLAPDFQIAYVHNVTEEKVDPATGQAQTIVVRQESSFWTPFLGAMAGSMVANALFSPNYMVPPAYSAGGLRGYGGYGNSLSAANQSYSQRYGSLPPASRLSTSGSLNSSRTSNSNLKSSGTGAGSSRLQTGTSSPSKSRSSFGSRRRR